MTADFGDLVGRAWQLAGMSGSPVGGATSASTDREAVQRTAAVTVTGPRDVLPAYFDVTGRQVRGAGGGPPVVRGKKAEKAGDGMPFAGVRVLDLTTPSGRETFQRLAATADVLLTGLHADALGRLGYDDAALASLNPALIIASLDAYGRDGPWRNRRGFDSLVQMSSGIAAKGAEAAGHGKPLALPVQALDHATGYLLAAAVGRALARRLNDSAVSRIRASLIGTASFLWSLPAPAVQPPMPRSGEFALEDTTTEWGPARRVPLPGQIAGITPGGRTPAGPLGRHEPAWE